MDRSALNCTSTCGSNGAMALVTASAAL